MEKNACGIVSYAGLSRETLLSAAKAAFAQAQPPAPKRFDAFLPIFPMELIQNMDYLGPGDGRGARSGFSIDPAEYHRKLYTQSPELYAEENYSRNFDYEGRYVGRGVFTVDRAWIDHFPQYQPFIGEKLMIYLIGGGFQAVAVPESVYPRGGGVLQAVEQALQITQRAELFMQYARARISAGDRYDAETFSTDYIQATGLNAVAFTQKELGRILQDLSMVKSLQGGTESVGLYTENARRAERVNQYVPMRYACDQFIAEAVDKHTARLAQLHYSDSDFISDLWIPYQDFYAYVDKRAMKLNVRNLCEGYQIAPRYDPETTGGYLPDAVRVAVVRDRDMEILAGEVINNPAYGDGMGPQGMIGRQVYIADSREMIRQRKLAPEDFSIETENLTLTPAEYRRCLALAVLQEHKGRLVDAMYRRETVLAQIDPEAPVYQKACRLLDERVDKLLDIVKRESEQSGMSQMSGYDADVDYLRRKQQDREGEPEASTGAKPIAFARDTLREQSIESGYAMRAGLLRMMYADAALPEPPAEQNVGADDSEEDGANEPLPPIASGPARAADKSAPDLPPIVAEEDEVTVSGPRTVKKPAALQSGVPTISPVRPAATDTAPQPGMAGGTAQHEQPYPTAEAGNHSQPVTIKGMREPEPPLPPRRTPEGNTADAPESVATGNKGTPAPAGRPDGNGGEKASTVPAGKPMVTVQTAEIPVEEAENSAEEAPSDGNAFPGERLPAADDSATRPQPRITDAEEAVETPPEATEEPNIRQTAASVEEGPASPEPRSDVTEGEEAPEDEPGNADETEASKPRSDVADGPEAPDEKPSVTAPLPHQRVSLRELTDRAVANPESKAEEIPATPQNPAPKLAYVLRRGSEVTASKSYSRMSEILHKRGE